MKHEHYCSVHDSLYPCERLGCTKPHVALCDACIVDYPVLSPEELKDLALRAGRLIADTSEAISFLKEERDRQMKEGGGEPRVPQQEKVVLMPEQLDIIGAQSVDIVIRDDGKVVWVNVDGICRLRANRIEHLSVTDQRQQKSNRVEAGQK